MVRTFAAATAAMICVGATSACAQTIDWGDAGGDLFGRPVEIGLAEAKADPPRLGALSQPYMDAIGRAADRHGLDEKLLHALIVVESAYRADAISSAGAGGLTQLMPATADELGVVDRFDIEQNLMGGADYLARQLLRFGDLRLALAAYNAGPGRVARLGRIPEIEETRTYVARVVECYLALAAGRSVRVAPQCLSSETVR
ncbi:lytic transglycosylase domain-containing protein [Brevundimonas sp.]|uniref:lytic transglycosylase domain-containing protein n=1 Tax=Brevundimonas sp. TaxID=1871086 RepID=UPI0035B13987